MQQEFIETSEQVSPKNNPRISHSSQDGSSRLHPGFDRIQGYAAAADSSVSRGSTPGSVEAGSAASGRAGAVNAYQLDDKLRRLSGQVHGPEARPNPAVAAAQTAGQRISDYENALTPSTPRQAFGGFKIVKPPLTSTSSGGTQLNNFPNEILTHIISHLHPDSHASVALVSKRFYALVTTPHAWRMAFLRQFPGQESMKSPRSVSPSSAGTPVAPGAAVWRNENDEEIYDRVRSESRAFTRLSPLASWRSEYLLRSRLLRSTARGKPGSSAGYACGGSGSKRASAVLTYNSKLPWMVSHVHADFSGGAKKPPRAIHGSADLCVGTLSDPTSGKIDKWGVEDPFSFSQFDEIFPRLEPYGLGDGPAAMPNIMDASQPYGIIGGEGFPGGRPFFRPLGTSRGRYLGCQDAARSNPLPTDLPKIPHLLEAISSVWIAKSSSVPSSTQSMVGMMTGSTLGVVTTYSLGYDSSGPRYGKGDITCRWVLSPGVPIIALRVDDNYSSKRKSLGRVWAVALNALGEVFYLVEALTSPVTRFTPEQSVTDAWYAGRMVQWQLIECTRRLARPDEFDRNGVRSVYSPRSSSSAMGLSKEQLASEAREIEKFMRYAPSHFRKACIGWDMRRKLEVDFGGDDGNGAGEAIVVVNCGHDPEQSPNLRRYTRRLSPPLSRGLTSETIYAQGPEPLSQQRGQSLFGSRQDLSETALMVTPLLTSAISANSPNPSGIKAGAPQATGVEEWRTESFCGLKHSSNAEITAVAIDHSVYAAMALFEDPLAASNPAGSGGGSANAVTGNPAMDQPTARGEIPGRRARMLAIGTNSGSVVIWNMRDRSSNDTIAPVRIIQTESPEVSCLALSALYLVHGGSDGLVQAWDPLASMSDPIRTINARSSGRLSRAILNANPMLRDANHSAVGVIYLDPDPTALRGVLAFGTLLRYWSYSSATRGAHNCTGRKGQRSRRHNSDVHHYGGRRHGGTVMGYIAAEEAELRREQEHRIREQARMRTRFGVGLGDLTETEAIRYAQMMSEESFLADEEFRRLGASDDANSVSPPSSSSLSLSEDAHYGVDELSVAGESTSTTPSAGETLTRDRSISRGRATSAEALARHQHHGDDEERDKDYERQIQQAIRLSLLEAGVNDAGQSPRTAASSDFEFQIKYTKQQSKGGKKNTVTKASDRGRSSIKHSPPSSSPPSTVSSPKGLQNHQQNSPGWRSATTTATASGSAAVSGIVPVPGIDDDLELALRLSLKEAEIQNKTQELLNSGGWSGPGDALGLGTALKEEENDEFPALTTQGKGKAV